jgi:hypothetical protein
MLGRHRHGGMALNMFSNDRKDLPQNYKMDYSITLNNSDSKAPAVCTPATPSILLDFLSAKYCFEAMFDSESRHLTHLLQPRLHQGRYGFHHALYCLSGWVDGSIEKKAPPQTFAIPTIASYSKRLTTREEVERTRRDHDRWRSSTEELTCIIYTDGPRTDDGHNGAGWVAEMRSGSTWKRIGRVHVILDHRRSDR